MGYRDDRDAMLARLDALERDLARAREEAEEGREARRALLDLERERDRLADEVARLRGDEEDDEPVPDEPLPRKSWAAIAGVLSLVGVLLFVNGIVQCRESAEEKERQRAMEAAPPPMPVGPADAAPRSPESVARRERLARYAELRACTDWLGGATRIALARHDERTARRGEDDVDLDVWEPFERVPEARATQCREAGGLEAEQIAALLKLDNEVAGIAEYREHEAYRDDEGGAKLAVYAQVHLAATRMMRAWDELAATLDGEAPAVAATLREETDDADLLQLVDMRAAARELTATVAANPSSAELEAAIERAIAAGEPLEDGSAARHRHLGPAFASAVTAAKRIRERAGDVEAVEPTWRELARVVYTALQFLDASAAHAAREADGVALP